MNSTPPSSGNRTPESAKLAAVCFVVLVVLLSCIVTGTFTNDEGHFTMTILGWRDGSFVLERTRGLMDSWELLLPSMKVPKTPISPQQPPLYAVLATPFAALGWWGLIALNAVAFVATGAMVHRLAARHARHARTPWIALALFWLGSFSLEYALGMWPHMLAVALVVGGLSCALQGRDAIRAGRLKKALVWFVAAGASFGLASGVRYQEIVYGALVTLGVLATLKWKEGKAKFALAAALGLAIGVAPALGAMSHINHRRLGIRNPLSKGGGFATMPSQLGGKGHELPQVVEGVLFRIVDYASKPATGKGKRRRGEPLVYAGVVKKSLLQSSPWCIAALALLPFAWRRARRDDATPADPRKLDRRVLSLVIFGQLGMFAWFGSARTSSFCFNVRYLLEVMPPAAVAVAWALEDLPWKRRHVLVGALLGAVLGAIALQQTWSGAHAALRAIPLVMAAAIVASISVRRLRAGAAAAIAAGLSWAACVHVAEDTRAALSLRSTHAHYSEVVARELTQAPTTLVAYWGNTTPFYPLQLDHPLMLLDPFMDRGKTARPLLAQVIARGDRVIILADGMPPRLLQHLLRERAVKRLPARELTLLEVR